MRRINQTDYYVGAFIVSLLNSTTGVPALFEETSDSRKLLITTNTGNHNLYIKKSSTGREAIKGKRTKKSFNIPFTEADITRLQGKFREEGYNNAIALVLSSEDLNETKIAIIPYDDAMKCLSKKTAGGSRRITVSRYVGEHYFSCYGVGQKEEEGVCVYVNHMRYFDEVDGKDNEEEALEIG